jgi:DNA-binding CsgD family transcriptional regulator
VPSPRSKSRRAAKPKQSSPPNLTRREDEILFWVSQGKSNRDIAAILEISPATVSKHLEHIYPKLGVENRTAAASFVPRDRGVTSKHLTFPMKIACGN